MAEGRNIAVALQLLLVIVHGARHIDGEHQLQIDIDRGSRRPGQADKAHGRHEFRHMEHRRLHRPFPPSQRNR